MPANIPIPPEFEARMRAWLGAEYEPFAAALAEPAAGLRVNTLRASPAGFDAISPFALQPLPFPGEGFLVDGDARAGKHPYHAAGVYYLQDPGAMAVGALADPLPGELVLDLAGAPGGKSTHLAARMRGAGVLVANDVHPGRARELAFNLERMGVRNAVVTNESAARLAARLGPVFDRVLLDAPCSGESMFHKSEAARADWSPASVAGCARRQGELLEEAARLVRPGGLLVYSTCTFSADENEAAVAAFLDAHPEFDAEPLAPVPGGAPGDPRRAPAARRGEALSRTLRLWPHRFPGAGHFVAALRRAADGPPLPASPGAGAQERAGRRGGPDPALRHLEEFAAEHLREDALRGAALEVVRDQLYAVPPGAPALDGLRVVRAGWLLGTAARGRFEPAHALAMALRPAEAARVLDLAAGEPDTLRYLRGEALDRAGEPGWVLVTVDGFPLGWGKRVGATVKNHYPKGLRWR